VHTGIAIAGTVAVVIGLLGTILCRKAKSKVEIPLKMLASTGFLTIALAGGALSAAYGWIVLGGLALCWFGDLALALPGQAIFLAGLVSFLLGHLAFWGAFLSRGVELTWCAGALVVLVVVGVFILRWMYPHLPKEMKAPVLAYIVVITIMVTLAVGTQAKGTDLLILIGGVAFYISDVFVARDRFVTPGFSNTLYGLPLYYLGVTLLAFSVAANVAR